MENRQLRIRNPKAPRFFEKTHDVVNDSFVEKLSKAHPEFKKNTTVEIRNIVRAFNKRVIQEVLDNRYGIQLPEKLGIIIIGLSKLKEAQAITNNIVVVKNGESRVVNFNNNNSNKLLGKIKFTNESEKNMVRHNKMWCFDASRFFCTSLSKRLKIEGNYLKYIVFTGKNHINSFFEVRKTEKSKIVTESITTKEKLLMEHDEFAI